MFRKVIGLVLVGGLFFTGCAKKETKAQNTEKKAVVEVNFVNNPLPEFSLLFANLDNLGSKDFSKAVQEKFVTVQDDVHKAAFHLGRLTADAVIATKARNKTILLSNAGEMIEYSKLLGLSDSILKLADELEGLIKQEQWTVLTKKLDQYKIDVELSLYETSEYDLFTLLQLGGWTEGLDRICYLLKDDYAKKNTDIISQKGITNALIQNLNAIKNPSVQKEQYYKVSLENFQKIKEIIYLSSDATFTKEQVNDLMTLTSEIKKNFISN